MKTVTEINDLIATNISIIKANNDYLNSVDIFELAELFKNKYVDTYNILDTAMNIIEKNLNIFDNGYMDWYPRDNACLSNGLANSRNCVVKDGSIQEPDTNIYWVDYTKGGIYFQTYKDKVVYVSRCITTADSEGRAWNNSKSYLDFIFFKRLKPNGDALLTKREFSMQCDTKHLNVYNIKKELDNINSDYKNAVDTLEALNESLYNIRCQTTVISNEILTLLSETY